jgi:hypothetical protein
MNIGGDELQPKSGFVQLGQSTFQGLYNKLCQVKQLTFTLPQLQKNRQQ